MATASGSIAAARSKKYVGDSWWIWCPCSQPAGEGAGTGDLLPPW